jgi:hypothetical protein
MLSGVCQPMGSLELVYWRAYQSIRDEQRLNELEAFGMAGF